MYLKHRTGWVMFVNKIFQLVKPFLANLRSSRSKKYSSMYLYSMTPSPNFFCILYMNIKNTQNFMQIPNPLK